jgi:hypothetical protein
MAHGLACFCPNRLWGLGNSHGFGQYKAVQQTGWLRFDKQDVKIHG